MVYAQTGSARMKRMEAKDDKEENQGLGGDFFFSRYTTWPPSSGNIAMLQW